MIEIPVEPLIEFRLRVQAAVFSFATGSMSFMRLAAAAVSLKRRISLNSRVF